jgi:hypothetical protein
MCIPHGATGTKSNGYIDIKAKKHIKKVSQDIFEKGDPNFVDERSSEYIKPKEKKSFLSFLFDE